MNDGSGRSVCSRAVELLRGEDVTNVQEAIARRRSIRSFRPNPVPMALVEELLEAARLAPSGGNRQPWRFLVVTDPEEKKRVRALSLDQRFLEEAPVLIICFGNTNAFTKAAGKVRYQEFEQFGVLETLSGFFADPEVRRQLDAMPEMPRGQMIGAALANTFIAIEHLVLMATALGLGSCWVGALGGPGELNALFGLPDNLIPAAIVPIGYTDKWPSPRPRLPMEEILLRPMPKGK